MKPIRTLSLILAVLCTAGCLFACKNNGDSDPFAYDYDLTKYITVADYASFVFQKSEVSPTAAEILTQKNTDFAGKEIGRAVKKDDTVIIDYTGKKDGIAFEGGTAQNQSLKIGSKTFIDGFEDGLIGVMPGETVDLNLTFPKDYKNNPDLAGKDVVFTVTVHYIATDSTTAPKLTDELVSALSDYKTVSEYEKAMEENLASTKLENAVWNKLLAESVFKSLPKDAVKQYRENFIANYRNYATAYGTDLITLLQQMGTNEKEFLKTADEYAENQVKSDLILYAVSRTENITVTEEQRKAALEELYNEYSTQYDLKDVDAMIDMLGEEEAEKLVLHEVVIDFVADGATYEG